MRLKRGYILASKRTDLSVGAHVVYGRPGTGKTYFLAERALRSVRRGRPAVTDFRLPGCLQFDDRLLHGEMIYDSDIYLDEAYKYFNSRNFRSFSSSMHDFFSLHRHNGNTIYLGTQHPARLDVVIRELVDDFVLLSATSLPFVDHPVWFTRRFYFDDPCRVPTVAAEGLVKPFAVERSLFSWSVARAYDTHALRSTDVPLDLVPW